MSTTNLENFRPKLRPGRVIPHGSRLIFETDDPYNQIILPMALADLVLLCSGQFTVREIIQKIYKRQGAVPFKAILKAIHVLQQGDFFVNGNELALNSHLRSWMEPGRQPFALSWRFGQSIVAAQRKPGVYYAVTLTLLVCSLLGLQSFPSDPLRYIMDWINVADFPATLIMLLICSSVIQSVRHLCRGIQLLLHTGKAYNVAVQISPWGVHLHVGDEANDFLNNRLYSGMFYVSQIVLGWGVAFFALPYLGPEWREPLIVLNIGLTFWELNPFVNSEGLRLIQSLFLNAKRETLPWHFEVSSLIRTLHSRTLRNDRDFARVCFALGSVWLGIMFYLLYDAAKYFGPHVLDHIIHLRRDALAPAISLAIWMAALYFTVQALIETVVASAVRPRWPSLRGKLRKLSPLSMRHPSQIEIAEKIQDLPVFSHLQGASLARVIDLSQVLEFPDGAAIINQGEPSLTLYVLLEGEVDISRTFGNQSERLIEMAGISIFGEAALLDDSPRAAQVRAKGPTLVLQVPISVIRRIAEESHVIRHLEDFRNAILVNQFFASSPIFRSLSIETIEFLCSRGQLEYFDRSKTIFNQGDVSDSIYLILRGSVYVMVHGVHVKHLTQGNFFGEIALLANVPRTGKVSTVESCVFFKIPADSFWEVLVQHIDLGVIIETISEGRLREDLEVLPARVNE